MNIAVHEVIRLMNSTNASSCRVPTSKDEVNNGFVEFNGIGWKVVQRAVAMKSFYGPSEGQYGTALVFPEKQKHRSENSCSPEKISVWLRKALVFSRVALDALENGLRLRHIKELLEVCLRHKKEASLHSVVQSHK